MAPAGQDGAGSERQAPGAPTPPARNGLAIANLLGMCVQLNGDGLDAAHGFVIVAVAAATATSSFNFEVQVGKFRVGRNFKFELVL
jgi:hypothetical protein